MGLRSLRYGNRHKFAARYFLIQLGAHAEVTGLDVFFHEGCHVFPEEPFLKGGEGSVSSEVPHGQTIVEAPQDSNLKGSLIRYINP